MEGFKAKISPVGWRSVFSIILNITPGLGNSLEEKLWLLVSIVELSKFPMMLDGINIYDRSNLTIEPVQSNIILTCI